MKRRQFIGGLAGAAAWPLVVRAQQPAIPVVGFLRNTSLAGDAHPFVTGFRQGLTEAGLVEGQNVAVEYHSAEGQSDRLRDLVADLISRPVAVIVGNTNAALAAKTVTTTVPIVFATGTDPAAVGLVANLNRPGGNVTGVIFFGSALGAKRLELLRQLVPNAKTIGVLVNPANPNTEAERKDVQEAAQIIQEKMFYLEVNSERDLETAFVTALQGGLVRCLPAPVHF